jgi:hypothetical protein
MNREPRMMLPQKLTRAHHRPARPNPGDKRAGSQPVRTQLPVDLRASGRKVRLRIVFIRELAREE